MEKKQFKIVNFSAEVFHPLAGGVKEKDAEQVEGNQKYITRDNNFLGLSPAFFGLFLLVDLSAQITKGGQSTKLLMGG